EALATDRVGPKVQGSDWEGDGQAGLAHRPLDADDALGAGLEVLALGRVIEPKVQLETDRTVAELREEVRTMVRRKEISLMVPRCPPISTMSPALNGP